MGEFLRAMRNDGLDDRWTDVLYSNGNDTFIARLIQKNNEAGKLHHLGETRKCMVSYLEENPGLIRHPDGLLFWARECEKRADTIPELKCDDEALRKYLVVNESRNSSNCGECPRSRCCVISSTTQEKFSAPSLCGPGGSFRNPSGLGNPL